MRIITLLSLLGILHWKDVRPIFYRNCSQCHVSRWDEYREVYLYRDMVKRKIEQNQMPPGGMSDKDKTTILTWISQGALQ